MYKGDRSGEACILQIIEIFSYLFSTKLSFIYYRATEKLVMKNSLLPFYLTGNGIDE